MDIYGQIAQAVRTLSGNGNTKSLIFTADVTEVTGQICSVKIGDLLVTDVRLRSVINDETDMLLIAPKIGSQVLIADISGGECRSLVVLEYSEVESIKLVIGNTTLDIDSTGYKFNGGQKGGLIIIQNLTAELSKYSAALTALKTALDAFIPLGSIADGGALAVALKGALFTFQSPTFSDIENTKVKH